MTDRETVEQRLRDFGYKPSCSFDIPDSKRGEWLMVYENPYGRSSSRYFIGVFAGTAELRRQKYPSDLAARKDFERRAEELS